MSTIKPASQYVAPFDIEYDILKKLHELEDKFTVETDDDSCNCGCTTNAVELAIQQLTDVIANKDCTTKEVIKETIIEKPVFIEVEKPVEKIVYQVKVVEKPVIKEKVVEKVKVITKQNTVYKYIKDGKVVKSENKTTYITTHNNSFGTCSNDRYIVNKTVISKSEMDANKQRHINNVNRLKAAKAKQAA